MSFFNGYMLGDSPTITEYQNLFKIFTVIPFAGLFAALGFQKRIKNL